MKVFRRKDGLFCGKYKDSTGKWKYIYRKDKQAAKEALKQAIRDVEDSIVPVDKLSVGVYLNDWLEDMRDVVSKRTWVNHESIVRLHLNPTIGAKKLTKHLRGIYMASTRASYTLD